MGTPARSAVAAGEVGVIVLVAFAPGRGFRAALWLAIGRWAIRSCAGLSFYKILGSGREGGFRAAPGLSRQGVFCAFRTEADADAFLASAPAMRFLRAHTSEHFYAKLRAVSSRGQWSGRIPLAVTANLEPGSPVASLTRASIRPMKALAFWRHAAPSERALHAAPGCLLASGLGEAPLVRQATFTIWKSPEAMEAFARTGAHLDAIRATRAGNYFSEELFVRFIPYDMRGTWKGARFEIQK